MKTKVRALKKLCFVEKGKVHFVQIGEYAEIDDELLKKFLKLKAVEIVEEIESNDTSYSKNETQENEQQERENAQEESEEKERPDIVAVIEKMDSMSNKTKLIQYGNHLGIDGLTMEMTKEDIKAAIVNALEGNNDI